ncbi:MAG: hypothetical protein KJ958_08690 [Gammaproteobacteria bacterium]|nr:hypothetical protein [Gammaproteobacteria bacterium]MBU1979230.1 hypothetical protein [Gammaproteobacteria bacterium]
MNIHETIHNQLEAAIAGLSRARDGLASMKPDETQEIGRQIESAAFYLEDIQYNWASLERSCAARPAFTKPTSEAL